MRILAMLVLGLALAGCSTSRLALVGVDNPVTAERMYQVEQAAIVVVSGLNTYRTLCVNGTIPAKCKDVIIQLQSFTRPAAKQLVTLRAYFKANDKLNAINSYNTLIQLLADALTELRDAGGRATCTTEQIGYYQTLPCHYDFSFPMNCNTVFRSLTCSGPSRPIPLS